MPQIRPITDLRNTNEISEICHARPEPVFITKNGYGDLVIMSIETYEAITATAAIDTAIAAAEAHSLPLSVQPVTVRSMSLTLNKSARYRVSVMPFMVPWTGARLPIWTAQMKPMNG